MLRVLVVAVICGSAGQAMANDACSKLTDKTLRLDCYDRASKPADDAAPPKAAVNDQDLPGEFDVTDPADVWVSPNKYSGMNIELRNAQCLYADKNEYRCLIDADGSPLLVVATDVVNDAAKTSIQKDCGSVKNIASPKCKRTIHITPILNQQDDVNAMTKRIIIGAPTMQLYVAK